MTIKAKKSKINLREKLAELLNFRQIRDRLDGLGLYLGKDRTGTAENLAVRGGANVDDLQLAEISAALGGTAVDVFVYDTRRDSDGGAWRERTSHTSWYNEELNTATRGGRREFPAVAVIVTENDKVTIYDGDDPDLPMWMVFQSGGAFGSGTAQLIGNSTTLQVASLMLDGILTTCNSNSYHALLTINFLSETSQAFRDSGNYIIPHNIAERNVGDLGVPSFSGSAIVNSAVNDVAMTVLPNAPIDTETGLPIATIAVATDGGVSVIKDDGSVISTQSNTNYRVHKIDLQSNSNLFAVVSSNNNDNYGVAWANNYTNISGLDWQVYANWNSIGGFYYRYIYASNFAFVGGDIDATYAISDITTDSIGGLYGLTKTDKNPSDFDAGMVNYTTSTYNTGWMPGDTKLAALSDNTVETVGVDETNNLITNPTFVDTNSDGADDWTLSNNASTSTSNGVVTITNGSASFGFIFQIISTEIGKRYKFSVDVDYTGNNGRVQLGKDGASASANVYYATTSISSDQTIEYYFTAETENLYVTIGLGTSISGDSISYSNISVTETGELITNGTFDNGSEGWGTGTNSTFDPSTGQAVVGGTYSSGGYIYQTDMNFIEGKTYTVSAQVVSFTGAHAAFYVGPSSNGVTATTTGYHSFTFVYSSSLGGVVPLYLQAATSGETATFDNISVRLAEDDRSVNDNGLQVFGEITKSPVAPGADLVAYSGFSADNYLMQPYNPDLDFGTGDFCVMGWVNNTGTHNGNIINRYVAGGGSGLEFYISGGLLNLRMTESDWTASPRCESLSVIPAGTWAHVCGVRRSSVLEVYINGALSNTLSGYDYNLDTATSTSIGGIGNISSSFTGSMALLRISATAPTAEQIAKIYRDEKVLFTDGAQATLYGTSDAVTALAYDDKTELLHVGTSGGRSDFAGLRRINNTTTAVTTSISASNNLIAEQ